MSSLTTTESSFSMAFNSPGRQRSTSNKLKSILLAFCVWSKIPRVNKNNIKPDGAKKKKIAITISSRSNPISNKNKTMRNEINIPFLDGDMQGGCRRVIAGVRRPLDRGTIYWLSINAHTVRSR